MLDRRRTMGRTVKATFGGLQFSNPLIYTNGGFSIMKHYDYESIEPVNTYNRPYCGNYGTSTVGLVEGSYHFKRAQVPTTLTISGYRLPTDADFQISLVSTGRPGSTYIDSESKVYNNLHYACFRLTTIPNTTSAANFIGYGTADMNWDYTVAVFFPDDAVINGSSALNSPDSADGIRDKIDIVGLNALRAQGCLVLPRWGRLDETGNDTYNKRGCYASSDTTSRYGIVYYHFLQLNSSPDITARTTDYFIPHILCK